MASINTRRAAQLPPQGGSAPQVFEPSNTLRTHEGAPAARITDEMALRRSVCSCLLWENEFYEDGKTIADRITELASRVKPKMLADLAYDARTHFNLRHVPLLLCRVLARTGAGSSLVSETLAETIQRPDELSEFLALYWQTNGGKRTLSAQVKLGLSKAFGNFDAYQLAKYFSLSGEKSASVRGRDVLFMSHAKPKDETHAELFRHIAAKEAVQEGGADTWENALSGGADKKETFTRLLKDGKLGYLALLRNLRNMTEASVDPKLMQEAIIARGRGARRVLPFRYVAAARACPSMEPAIDQALSEAIAEMPVLSGKTTVLVDVSGSMDYKLSSKSDLRRIDAAAALASVIHGNLRVFTFSNALVEVPPRRGMSGIEAIIRSQPHQGTFLGSAITALSGGPTMVPDMDVSHEAYRYSVHRPQFKQVQRPPVEMDRLIVITDEQSQDHVNAPPAGVGRAYMINVASSRNGVGYGERWTHLDGFSEQVIRWIHEFESLGTPLV